MLSRYSFENFRRNSLECFGEGIEIKLHRGLHTRVGQRANEGRAICSPVNISILQLINVFATIKLFLPILPSATACILPRNLVSCFNVAAARQILVKGFASLG